VRLDQLDSLDETDPRLSHGFHRRTAWEATPGNGTPAVNWVAYGWPAGRLSAV
jgi:hypothetical protein